jgi:hypothetical protein
LILNYQLSDLQSIYDASRKPYTCVFMIIASNTCWMLWKGKLHDSKMLRTRPTYKVGKF